MTGAEQHKPPLTENEKQQRRARNAARRQQLADRRAKALELRKAGMTYKTIAEQTGVSETQARKDIETSIKAIYKEPAEQVLTLETERLDRLFFESYRLAISTDTNTDPVDKQRAANTCLKIMERRARLLGLDTLQPLDNTGEITGALTGFLTALQADHGD